ncbi:MAG TPA: hypothetical protein PLK30_25405 [Blastocatellia bacterium]|nr:hypothetical protein [Blastocatellia bacterium]
MANLLGNSSVLDNLIAIVVVILVLSLIVQSVQAVIKKLLQVKSLQMEQALVHLFHYVVGEDSKAFMNTWLNRLPMVRAIVSIFKKKAPHLAASQDIQTLFLAVEQEMIKAGRVTINGKVAMSSVPKDDLLKFMGNIPLSEILALFSKKDDKKLPDWSELATQLKTAQKAISNFNEKHGALIEKTPLAKVQEPLTQMLSQAGELFDSGFSNIRLGDMAKLGGLEVSEAQKLLSVLPASMQQSIAHLEEGAKTEAQQALQKLSDVMKPVQKGLQEVLWLPERMSNYLNLAGGWYDTIMHSLDERYARSMKTVAIVISFLVVITLNANLFSIYRQISGDQFMRDALVASADNVLTKLNEQKPSDQQIGEVRQALQQVKDNAKLYTGFGFKGPQWISGALGHWRSISWYQIFETLLGWTVMTALLSVGAPFWQDTLESLFGLKNLLRKQQPNDK